MPEKHTFLEPSIQQETIESLSAKLLSTMTQLTETNQELQKMQMEKNEMLSNISHDLRAPITAIRSAVDYLLSSDSLSFDDYQQSLHLIDRRTRTLENLIQDMYYLFCVEDTSKKLDLQPIDAVPFLEEYFYDTMIDTLYDHHNLHLELPQDLHCTLNIDLQKIIRVLDNLFTNAVKYSAPGSDITLSATLSESYQQLTISVSDNGFGIPQSALPNIFNRTYTVSSSRTPNSNTGSGLGLAIVKAIVERHHGNVSCSSKEGVGSCFSFTLPCQQLPCPSNH